jgi:hypothetical protein
MIILALQGSTEKTSLGEFPTKHRTLYIQSFSAAFGQLLTQNTLHLAWLDLPSPDHLS